MICEFEHKIFHTTPEQFGELALQVFRFQYQHNALYRTYADSLQRDVHNVKSLSDIPFLPISFFKTHAVRTGFLESPLIFESSGTTGTTPSRHWVKDPLLYQKAFREGFERFYGPPSDWCIIGLLPSYLERGHSSLVYMVEHLIRLSGHPHSGFYLYDHDKLARVLASLEEQKQQTLLLGVTFALMDFAKAHPMALRHTVVMETGGMKGRREALTREEVHQVLTAAFQTPLIHSEYGMTELFSQAYSRGHGLFYCPPWMKVLVREEDDPLTLHGDCNARGVMNVVDLANLYSCSFIATDDAARIYADGSFEVLGRIDHSEVRGCSLMTV